MPTAFYIIPYTRVLTQLGPCLARRDLDIAITAPSLAGQWREAEIRGNRAIVKINASNNALNQLDTAYKRLPKDALNTSLADLSAGVKQALKDELLDQGYTLSEINNRLPGDLGDYTLGDVLRFMASRWFKPRYDQPTDSIVFDGEERNLESAVDALDKAIS